MKYLIWSHEHRAWWGPERCGYTRDIKQAGRYTHRQAGDIVVPVIPPGEEVAVPEVMAERYQQEQEQR